MTASPRRWLILALAPLVTAVLVTAPTSPASAEPGGSSSTAQEQEQNGDSDALLSDVIENTNRRYVTAKAAVEKSVKAQTQLANQIKQAEGRRDALIPEVDKIAKEQYMTGNLSSIGYLLQANSSGDFLEKAVSLEEINRLHDAKLRELNEALRTIKESKVRLDAEVKQQQQNAAVMKKQKDQATDALALVGGKGVTDGLVVANSPEAAPAPRNSSGGFSAEGCTEKDPTTNGCVTKRTLHMYKEVKKAGFNNFVGCHRDGGPFEHPKGRACDWSLQKSGFSSFDTDKEFKYGNNLMAFLVRNGEELGIYYVIWNKKIWFPANGWSNYHGVSDHTDHVHVSML
ncbi:coiled-coil domain-containing protein [Actinoplanes xinjiangensis]|uniref:coiled-coil domain-containing protein n=1 Tax=Actinoplanes xinjiangensis TaxID=512350 RepID=UPI0034157B0D